MKNLTDRLRALGWAVGGLVRELFELLLPLWPARWARRYLNWRLANTSKLETREWVEARQALLFSKLIDVEERAGDLEAAECAAREIMKIRPGNPDAAINVAMVLEKRGQRHAARKLYLEAATSKEVEEGFRKELLQRADELETQIEER